MKLKFSATVSSLWDLVFNKRDTKPSGKLPRIPVDLSVIRGERIDGLRTTWLGHSSLLIQIDRFLIATDPVLEKSVSFFGPTRYNGDAPLSPDEMPPLDLVLISHNHYDHLNRFTIERIHQRTARFIVPLGVKQLLVDWGVPADKIEEVDWWQEVILGNGRLKITATPAQHFSGRGLTDRNKTLWCSYAIQTGHHSVFFGGDSGYFGGFKQIGERLGPFDITFLECGAYDDRWAAIHMKPEETVQAHLDLNGKLLHPIHWGTFDLAFHTWHEPMERVSKAAAASNVRLATPPVGGTVLVDETVVTTRWWEGVVASAGTETP